MPPWDRAYGFHLPARSRSVTAPCHDRGVKNPIRRASHVAAAEFRLLREALEQLSWDADEQGRALAGSDVTFELVDDLDNAVRSLPYECDRVGVTLDPQLTAALTALPASLDAPPDEDLWDPDLLDSHPTWETARRTAEHLLGMPPIKDGRLGQ